MSWQKIDDHLFHKYCVEGEDKELNDLMIEHDKELRNSVVDEFSQLLHQRCKSIISLRWNNVVAPVSWAHAYADFKDDIDDIVEQMKGE